MNLLTLLNLVALINFNVHTLNLWNVFMKNANIKVPFCVQLCCFVQRLITTELHQNASFVLEGNLWEISELKQLNVLRSHMLIQNTVEFWIRLAVRETVVWYSNAAGETIPKHTQETSMALKIFRLFACHRFNSVSIFAKLIHRN